jgi:DNA-binding Lrp family transcriptional regulator
MAMAGHEFDSGRGHANAIFFNFDFPQNSHDHVWTPLVKLGGACGNRQQFQPPENFRSRRAMNNIKKRNSKSEVFSCKDSTKMKYSRRKYQQSRIYMQNMPPTTDKIDRNILRVLQKDGRVSNVHLAEQVGLSESACLRRVRLLEQSGIIDRYVMLVNQAAIGKPGNVFVRVTLEGQQKDKLQQFEKAVVAVPEVMECYLMSGDFDYLLRVIVKDNTDYMRVHEKLTGLPGVLRVQSSFALRTVRKTTELALDN